MAFERMLHVAGGGSSDKCSDHNVTVASRDLLSSASEVLRSWGVAHKIVQPHEASSRSQPVLPHLVCTGDVPHTLHGEMSSLKDLQLLECEPNVAQGAVAAEPKFDDGDTPTTQQFRIFVVPDEWIVDCFPALADDKYLSASRLTGFARFELFRLTWTCPEAMLVRASSFARAPQPYSYDIRRRPAPNAV